MPEYVVKNKRFEVVSDGAETNVKVDVWIFYDLSNGTDEYTVPELIENYTPGSVSAAALTTREAAVLLAANNPE